MTQISDSDQPARSASSRDAGRKFHLKLLVGLLVFFGLALAVMLLWEPFEYKINEWRLDSNDLETRIAAVEFFLSKKEHGLQRLKKVYPEGPEAAELLTQSLGKPKTPITIIDNKPYKLVIPPGWKVSPNVKKTMVSALNIAALNDYISAFAVLNKRARTNDKLVISGSISLTRCGKTREKNYGKYSNEYDEYGLPEIHLSGEPIYHAAFAGNEEILRIILQHNKLNINDLNDSGFTALHYAAINNKPSTLKLLVQNGADVNWGLNEVINPASSSGICFTFEGGFKDKTTALHFAAIYGHKEVTKVLLDLGADINATNNEGETPLHCALWYEHAGVAGILLDRGADPNLKTTSTVYEIMNLGETRYGCTPLHYAAWRGNVESVKLLLAKGADIEAGNNKGNTPLAIAALMARNQVVEFLIENGANLNARNKNKEAPLFKAIYNIKEKWELETVKLLVDSGADLNFQNNFGDTVVHEAARYGEVETIEYLLEKGAPVNVRGYKGLTPLHEAADSFFLEQVEVLLKWNAKINTLDDSGNTPLMLAIKKRCAKTALFLIKAGADASIADKNQETTLHSAVKYDLPQVIKPLIAHGLDVDVKNSYDFTPLHVAASKGNLRLAKLLLENKADVNARSKLGFTPLDKAENRGSESLEKLLRLQGAKTGAELDAEKSGESDNLGE